MEGGKCASTAQHRHGTTKRLPVPHLSSSIAAVRVRTRKRNSGPLSFPMHQMDSVSHRDDAMHRHTAREYFILPGRQILIGRWELDTEHGGSSRYDTLRDSNKTA